jgi:hypothetical protein
MKAFQARFFARRQDTDLAIPLLIADGAGAPPETPI